MYCYYEIGDLFVNVADVSCELFGGHRFLWILLNAMSCWVVNEISFVVLVSSRFHWNRNTANLLSVGYCFVGEMRFCEQRHY